jgi:ketosteroid isomerase-like protein
MSQENVQRAHRAYEALQHGDIDAFLMYVDPAVEWHSLVLEMEGTLHGHEGVRLWWTNLLAVFPDWAPVLVEARDLGDFVVMHARATGSAVESGVGIDQDFWQAAEMQDGRIVWYAACRTEREALEAAGLREQAMSRDNVDALRRGYEMFNDGNPEWFLSKLDSEFVYRARDELPGGGEFEGRGTFEDRIAALRDVFAEVHFEPEEFVEAGDLVVVALRQTARGRTSGAALEQSITHVWRIEEGTARELRVFSDHAEALAAVGLRS